MQAYKEYLNEKQIYENNLIDIGLHSKGLAEYLTALDIEGLELISSWFQIAYNIKGLDYDGITYDSGYFMCRPAYEYEIEKQELYQRLVKEMTIFSYLYSGIEGIIEFLELGPCPKAKGKINSATYFLKSKLSEWIIPVQHYDYAVRLCEKMYKHTFDKTYRISNELKECVSIHGLGLRLVYKIRNKIMHGDFFFPEPLEHSEIPPFQPEIINLCSRIILLTVQMLFLSFRMPDYDKIEIFNSSIITTEDQTYVNEKVYLMNFHCSCPNLLIEQLQLDFN